MSFDYSTIRAGACKIRPYLARPLCNLNPVPIIGFKNICPGGWAVDEFWRMYFDPIDLEELTLEQLVARVFHEKSHPLRLHFERYKSLGLRPDGQKWTAQEWNMAGDREINGNDRFLRKHGDDWWCWPEQIGMRSGLLAEEYLIFDPDSGGGDGEDDDGEGEGEGGGEGEGKDECGNPGNPGSPGTGQGDCGSGCGGEQRPWELGPPTAQDPGIEKGQGEVLRELTAQDIQDHVKTIGSVAGTWEGWAEKALTPPVVPWQQVLSRYLRQCIEMSIGAHDFTHRKPNRRQSAYGNIIMPASYRPKVEVGVVLDTSGSMSEADLSAALCEIDGILRAAQANVQVVCCDSQAHAAQNVSNARTVKILGRGGTDMTVGLRAASKGFPVPHVLVCLTDGYTDWPQRGDLPMPVIAGVIASGRWGKPSAPPSWIHAVDITREGE